LTENSVTFKANSLGFVLVNSVEQAVDVEAFMPVELDEHMCQVSSVQKPVAVSVQQSKCVLHFSRGKSAKVSATKKIDKLVQVYPTTIFILILF
jgi:hypothetical protein